MLVVKHEVSTYLPIFEIEDNMIIFEKGDEDTVMYFVLEGSVSIYIDKNGTEHDIALINKNNFFGDSEMYSRLPRSTSAKAVRSTKLVVIKTEEEFEQFITKNNWLTENTMEKMSKRLAETHEALITKNMSTSAIQVELNPNAKEDKSARRIIHR